MCEKIFNCIIVRSFLNVHLQQTFRIGEAVRRSMQPSRYNNRIISDRGALLRQLQENPAIQIMLSYLRGAIIENITRPYAKECINTSGI